VPLTSIITIFEKKNDRIEYEGISTVFCYEVATDALAAKRKREGVLKFTDAVAESLRKNEKLSQSQRTVATRLATVLIARIYVDPEIAGNELALADVECTWTNTLLRGQCCSRLATRKVTFLG
jgi:hypothetical protein